jgi:hypothetical protein
MILALNQFKQSVIYFLIHNKTHPTKLCQLSSGACFVINQLPLLVTPKGQKRCAKKGISTR